jgi:hypothetical protein
VWYVGVQTEVSPEVAAELTALDSGEGAILLPGEGPDPMPRACPLVAAQTRALTALLGTRAAADAAALAARASPRASSASSAGGGDAADAGAAASACSVLPLVGAPATAENVNPALLRSLVKIQQSFCLSDPKLPDCPIVHASQGFLDLTGATLIQPASVHSRTQMQMKAL